MIMYYPVKDSKLILLQDTLAHNDASPYKVRLQKVKQLRRYQPDEHSREFWAFLWPWPQQNNPIFSQDNPVYHAVPSNQV